MDGKLIPAYSWHATGHERLSRGTLGMVVAVHAGVIFYLATARLPVPAVVETPIQVSLVTAEAAPVHPQKSIQPQQVIKPAAKPEKKKAEVPVQPPAVRPEPTLVSHTPGDYVPDTPAPVPQAAETPSPSVAETPRRADAPPQEPTVEQPRFNADYLENPAPAYPPLSRKLREEGQVLLRVKVSADGKPIQVTLHQSSGYARLDERAEDTVRRWKFIPARRADVPVEAWVIVPIQFSLKG